MRRSSRLLLLVGILLAILALVAMSPSPVAAYEGCRPEPVTSNTPTGIAGCEVWGEGIASRWPGPGVARNDCVWPWDACVTIRITSIETFRSITVTPVMFGDLYTGTPNERIVDLDPAAVEALGLDWSTGLYRVKVEPAMPSAVLSLPDTSMPLALTDPTLIESRRYESRRSPRCAPERRGLDSSAFVTPS